MNGRHIELANLLNENVVIEEERAFKESVYASVYRKAELLWEEILKQNDHENKSENRTEKQINNTISFEGRRGTGKTSAMLSFSKKLEGNKQNVVLDYIDASTMEEGEDIIILVLANMYNKFTENDKEYRRNAETDYKSRELYGAFEEVVSQLYSIKRARKGLAEESSLRILDRLSSSQMLKKSMEKLVKKYLDYMVEGQSKQNPAMLVVTIDDIDMHFQGENTSAFDILENLHRYLMISGVVILLTFDYPELVQGCEKHFIQMYHAKQIEQSAEIDIAQIYANSNNNNIRVNGEFEVRSGSDRKTTVDANYRKKQVKRVANTYLEKILPAYTRIHMPSQKKRDYAELDNIIIEVKKEEVEKYFKQFKIRVNQDKPEKMNFKEFVFRLKAATADLYYDGNGMKRHFAEPSNLRELVHVFTLFKQLQRLDKQRLEKHSAETDSGDDVVFKELLDDLYFRFARINLSEEEYERFNRYLEVPIERRSQDILREIRSEADQRMRSGSDRDYSVYKANKVSRVRYVPAKQGEPSEEFLQSYGELIYGLYIASDTGIYSKPLICCILDSYTIMLTKLYRVIKRDIKSRVNYGLKIGDKGYESKSIDRFKDVLGSSISSSWSNELVPRLKFPAGSPSGSTNYATKYSKGVEVGAVRVIKTDNYQSWELVEKEIEAVSLDKRLPLLELMFMFFTSVKSGEDDWFAVSFPKLEKRRKNAIADVDPDAHKYEAESSETPIIKFKFTEGCFNVMNFVTNLFDGDAFFKTIHENKQINELIKRWEKTESVGTFVEKYSLKNDFEDWKKDSYGFAMPLYSLDVMYNIMKRQHLKHRRDAEQINAEDFVHELKKIYKEIGGLLKEEDKFYYGIDNGDIINGFSDIYNKSPFIRFFSDIKDGSAEELCLTTMIESVRGWN